MPTPVSVAKQCLTEVAARALDEAVAVARRRSHAQTTSLHAVSALLALPSSTLRDACSRARSCAYSPRLQFRALELCVGVSLDRLPSSKGVEDPPVSNSLMAAIKRSQANQRRQPETFLLYQQMQQQNQSSLSCVKVELKHFILSILDDPIVSRLFGEAGFRSCDIKIAIVNPPPISRFSRSQCPPKFLFNLTDSDSNLRNFNFPFSSGNGDENCRRIGEILVRKKGKNPLLIGVCSTDALSNFTVSVQSGRNYDLPPEIHGLNVVCIQKEICEFVAKGGSEEIMEYKFKELEHMVEICSGPGIVISYGGLNVLMDDDDEGPIGPVSYVVSQLTALLEAHGDKLWLMGSAGTYETYTKFIARFHSIDRNWDLNLLPITSSPSIGELYSKSSLMGSFVPLGGFFPTTSEMKPISSSTNESFTHCHPCHEKYVQEVSVLLKGRSSHSHADQHWLQGADCNSSKRSDVAKDDRIILSGKLVGLQRKWNDTCNRLHCNTPFQPNISEARSQAPGVEGFQLLANGKETCVKETTGAESGIAKISKADNANSQSSIQIEVSRSGQLEMGVRQLRSYPVHCLNLPPDCTPLSRVTSVTTDLGLGTLYAYSGEDCRKAKLLSQKGRVQPLSGSVSAEFEDANLNQIAQSSLSVTKMGGQFDPTDFKSLWRDLATKVGWQEEAVQTVCVSVSRCRQGNGRRRASNYRGDVWLCLHGPDRVGKRKIALALAELIFGSNECLISVDLSSEDGIGHSNSIFGNNQDSISYNEKSRGKTAVDYIAQELSKKPRSVVLLENIDKSDFVSQNSLSQAITTGKFPDSHGREINVNNMIFIVTSTITKVDENVTSLREHAKFSEERILEARGWQMQIVIECNAGDVNITSNRNMLIVPKKGVSNPFPNKRKAADTAGFREQEKAPKALKTCLDLNLPVEEMEEEAAENEKSDSDSASENSKAWLEDFLDQVDQEVSLKPFDFDGLAKKVLRKVSSSFRKIAGLEPLLEIDEEVMVQILAASWISDRKSGMEDWIEQVLSPSLEEAMKIYHLNGCHKVKLVACEGCPVDDQVPGICLPARITVN